MTQGILLLNLGTPDAPEAPEVRRYLREFLSDPRVLDINPLGRAVLVNGIIAPFRAPKSAEAYRQVWTEQGSPLLVHSLELRDALRAKLPGQPIELAMRYGNPGIGPALDALIDQGCDEILAAPLYPQYASSSTGSSLEAVYREAAKRWNTPYIEVLPAFYDAPEFLDAFAAVGRPVLEEFQPDHVLFSYHGLPERHCTKSDPTGRHCLASANCCDALVEANRNCYRAQCFATTRGLRPRLGLNEENSTICFQSRLGRTPWIKPYTDELVTQLAKAGKRRMAVFCPAFTADCLETLEEIGMRAKEDFVAGGGEDLVLVPSLNAHPVWVEGLARRLGKSGSGAG